MTILPFMPLFPSSFNVATRKTAATSSISSPNCHILFASIALFAYRYPPRTFPSLIARHHQPQWLNTPMTKWISSFVRSCHMLLKSCTTSFHLRVGLCSHSPSHTSLMKSPGANEVLLGLNTVESKVAYLLHIIAIELYKASKAISPKVRLLSTPLPQAY